MRIPKTLQIGKHKWTVLRLKGYEKRYKKLGVCRYHSKEIIIDADQPREQQEITFVHEILHAIWPINLVSPKTEENLVEELDVPLYEVLRRNKL